MSWSIRTALELGRVSNLPTVWTNTVAGVVLSGASSADWRLAILILAMTLAYIGGMFLNDAFDADIDAVERPERPIPSGTVSALSVTVAGFALLASSIILIALVGFESGNGIKATLSAFILAASIVLYNAWHKNNPLSPFVMGLCRMFVYITSALAVTQNPSAAVYVGAIVILAYLIGLTYTAKQENLGEVKNLWPLLFLAAPVAYAFATFSSLPGHVFWLLMPLIVFILWLGISIRYILRRNPGDIPKAVGSLIAGISLIDAIFLGISGFPVLVFFAIACCFGTVYLQRWVAGT